MSEKQSPIVWSAERVTAVPARSAAAFVVPKDRGRAEDVAGIWYGPLDGRPTRLHEAVPDTNLVGSPDGALLAFAVQQDASSKLLMIPTPQHGAQGDPAAIREIELPGFAEVLAWSESGLVALTADLDADTASLSSGKPHEGEAMDPLVIKNDRGWRRLWRIDPSGATAPAQLSPDGLNVWEFALLPDGGAVAVASNNPSENGWYRSHIARLSGELQGPAQVIHRSDWQLSSPAVDPAGERIAWIEGWSSDRGLLAGDLQTVRLEDHTAVPRTITLPLDVTSLKWDAADRLWFAGWQGVGTSWGSISSAALAGDERAIESNYEAGACVNSSWHPEVAPVGDGTALSVRSSLQEPPEVVRLSPGNEPRGWSALNQTEIPARPYSTQEITWTAADGTPIQGLLFLPESEPQRPALVVDIHGGPSVTYHHAFKQHWPDILAQDGLAVLLPNPRGGVGRGQEFSRGNHRDPGGVELEDVIAGIRYCAEQGLVDGDRVAAIGGSYGGYLTACAINRPEVFRCGVVMAGVTNLISCRNTANNASFYDFLMRGTPQTSGQLYLERSPVLAVDDHSAPALIIHGQQDSCVPVSQAYELNNALHAAAVEVQLVVYPREGHQMKEPAHIEDCNTRVRAWFKDHLG
jgi:dipeptidyl aminopeptidase/acylaminoacyl peptidase